MSNIPGYALRSNYASQIIFSFNFTIRKSDGAVKYLLPVHDADRRAHSF